jgi:hypothetical protein
MTADWKNRGGTVSTGVVLTPMDMNVEHTFELTSIEIKEKVQTPYGIKDKVETIWSEVGKPKENAHRVWLKFNESYADKSGLVAFIRRASPKPIIAGANIKLGDYLDLGMKIKVLVQARIDNKTGQPNGYYDFIPASIKPLVEPQGRPSGASLADLMVIAKGCKSSGDVFAVAYGKVSAEVIQEFIAADKAGKVVYPIA